MKIFESSICKMCCLEKSSRLIDSDRSSKWECCPIDIHNKKRIWMEIEIFTVASQWQTGKATQMWQTRTHCRHDKRAIRHWVFVRVCGREIGDVVSFTFIPHWCDRELRPTGEFLWETYDWNKQTTASSLTTRTQHLRKRSQGKDIPHRTLLSGGLCTLTEFEFIRPRLMRSHSTAAHAWMDVSKYEPYYWVYPHSQ